MFAAVFDWQRSSKKMCENKIGIELFFSIYVNKIDNGFFHIDNTHDDKYFFCLIMFPMPASMYFFSLYVVI